MMRPTRLVLAAFCLLVLAGCPPPARLTATEKPGSVAFEIASQPQGASVNVDGAAYGDTPVTIRLTPGAHRVQLNKSGYFPLETPIQVPAQGGGFTGTLVASH